MVNYDVAQMFLKKQPADTTNLHTNGQKLFSYSTCIAEHTPDEEVIGNATKYSSTTPRHLGYIREKVTVWTSKPVPRGAKSLMEYL